MMVRNIWNKFVNLVNGVEQKVKDLSKKAKIIISVIISVLGIGGIITASSQSLGPIWPTYTDRLYSFDGNLAWTALTGNGNFQAQNDDMWVGRGVNSSVVFNDTIGTVSTNVVGGGQIWTGNATSPRVVSGFSGNVSSGVGSSVLGGGRSGDVNTASGNYSVVVGGYELTASGDRSGIFAGGLNSAGCSRCVVIGGSGNDTGSTGENIFMAGSGNTVDVSVYVSNAMIFGSSNIISSSISTGDIIMGTGNVIDGTTTGLNFIAGDSSQITSSTESTILTADDNLIDNSTEVWIGGSEGTISDSADSAILTGQAGDIDNADFAVVINGNNCDIASGADYALAGGHRAKANAAGCFVWGDSTNADVTCSNANRTIFRNAGGHYIYTNAGLTTGMYLAAGGSAWNAVSDRESKEDFETVNGEELLSRIVSMSTVETWKYKDQGDDILHVGAMADEFNNLVDGLGGEGADRINQGDAIGVNLAAIQELARQVDDLKSGQAVTQSQAYQILLTQPHIVVSLSILAGSALVSGSLIATRKRRQ